VPAWRRSCVSQLKPVRPQAQPAGLAPAPVVVVQGLATRVHYERHRPEQTTLYRLVQQHAATFIAQAEDAAGADLPQFVKDEFDAFLKCSILTHGFLRLHCGDCCQDKLVAFSCKRRGFCPSRGAQRMAQTAAHLVDHVIPHVPMRQWALSLPIPLRLVLDGVYRRVADGVPEFVEALAPADEALQTVLHKIITLTMKLPTRRGVLVEEEGSTDLADNDGDSDEAGVFRPRPPDKWYSSSRQPGATGPPTWSCRRWCSCSGWQRWCQGRDCT